MSKKHYDYKTGKYKGFNTTRGWLLSDEQVAKVAYFLFLAGQEFKYEALRKLRNGMPKNLVLHEVRKFRETQQIREEIDSIIPYAYVKASIRV